ncbi:unnamed protein product [Symbiodinium sp. CCMP2592]|nr:unnamed protein product [Symbiodinium sp. CCMP2592]
MVCNRSTACPYFASDWGVGTFAAMATAIGAEAVQAVLDGFQSPKAEEILASLRTLAGLLKTAGEEEDRWKVVSLLERASAHAASREDTAGEIAMVVKTFLMSLLLLIMLLSVICL